MKTDPTQEEPVLDPELSEEVTAGEVDPNEESLRSTEEDAGAAKGDEGDSQIDPKAEKRVKDAQAALTRANQEKAELKKRLELLDAKLDGVLHATQKPKDEPNPFGWIDDEKELEEVYSDPKNLAKREKRMLQTLVQVLETRDSALTEMLLSEVKKVDPTRRELAEKVAELREDPDYEGFSEDQLVVLARKAAKSERKETVEENVQRDNFRGSAGGSRRVYVPKPKKPSEEEERMYKRLIGEE